MTTRAFLRPSGRLITDAPRQARTALTALSNNAVASTARPRTHALSTSQGKVPVMKTMRTKPVWRNDKSKADAVARPVRFASAGCGSAVFREPSRRVRWTASSILQIGTASAATARRFTAASAAANQSSNDVLSSRRTLPSSAAAMATRVFHVTRGRRFRSPFSLCQPSKACPIQPSSNRPS